MAEVVLAGCRPEPLAGYLKAVGVLRVLGTQLDAGVRGFWRGDAFVLETDIPVASLVDFLTDRYAPAPLVAPWNGGSGFQPQDKMPADTVAALLASDDVRLEAYRRAARAASTIVSDHLIDGLVPKEAKAKARVQAAIRLACRNQLPDEALDYFDAAVVLATDRSVFPPLLGTGGNDGKLEFSNNYLRHVLAVVGAEGKQAVAALTWLQGALFGDVAGRLAAGAIGQFSPGAAGAANSSPTGAADSMVNPWDFVLMCEGALVFASSAARRMSGDARGKSAIPFTFTGSAAGLGNAAERGELWLPLWDRASTAAEVSHLVGEGRAEWRGRQAKSGVDVVRAVASLGVRRGIGSFVRYGIDVRMGRQMLAVPAGRFMVRSVPEVALLRHDLDRWLDRIRGRLDKAPGSIAPALHRAEAAIFALAGAAPGAHTARSQSLLVELACLEAVVARATHFREEARVAPLELEAKNWLEYLDDGTFELSLAAAIALQSGPGDSSMRELVKPVQPQGRRLEWSSRPALVAGLGVRPIVAVLADVLARRLRNLDSFDEQVGVIPAWPFGPAAPSSACEALAGGVLDERRLDELVRALLILSPTSGRQQPLSAPDQNTVYPVPNWRMLAPYFARHRKAAGRVAEGDSPKGGSRNGAHGVEADIGLRAEPRWGALLVAGNVAEVLTAAHRRARIAGLRPVFDAGRLRGTTRAADYGTRLAAALLPALGADDGITMRRTWAPDPADETQDEALDRNQTHTEENP